MRPEPLENAPPTNTDLIRLAWLTPGTSETERLPAIAELGPVRVSEIALVDLAGKELILVEARLALAYLPKVSGDGRVVVPRQERTDAEAAIDCFADLYAIANRSRCVTTSPVPSVYFEPRDDRSKKWFASYSEVHQEDATRGIPDPWVPIDLTELPLDLLTDRADGVQLLAEAVSSSHPTGRFHELVRFFERAFARPGRKLAPLVRATLDGRFQYTEAEVENWFALRDPATHADQRQTFVTSADVVPSNARMMQAAYDLLFNKLDWRNPGTDRRSGWRLPVGTTSNAADMLLTRGEPFEAKMCLLDEFGVYPWSFKYDIGPDLPDDWWPADRTRRPTSLASGSMQVGDP